MAEFTVLVLKVAFLAILWLFIILVAAVVNSDMVGRRQKSSRSAEGAESDRSRKTPSQPWVLAIDSGSHAGDRLQLVPLVHIGRSDGCELVLNDDYVSATHARLSHSDDSGWTLADLGSTNGTYVNGERILDPTPVSTEDIIRVGDVQMRLEH